MKNRVSKRKKFLKPFPIHLEYWPDSFVIRGLRGWRASKVSKVLYRYPLPPSIITSYHIFNSDGYYIGYLNYDGILTLATEVPEKRHPLSTPHKWETIEGMIFKDDLLNVARYAFFNFSNLSKTNKICQKIILNIKICGIIVK